MFKKLFHKDVFFISSTEKVCKHLQQNYFDNFQLSHHLEEWFENNNRSHDYTKDKLIECLKNLSKEYREVVEVECSKDFKYFGKKGWFITKYVCRLPYDTNQDLVVVVRPQWDTENKCYDKNRNLIATAWLNAHSDNHGTLDASKYTSKDEFNSL